MAERFRSQRLDQTRSNASVFARSAAVLSGKRLGIYAVAMYVVAMVHALILLIACSMAGGNALAMVTDGPVQTLASVDFSSVAGWMTGLLAFPVGWLLIFFPRAAGELSVAIQGIALLVNSLAWGATIVGLVAVIRSSATWSQTPQNELFEAALAREKLRLRSEQ